MRMGWVGASSSKAFDFVISATITNWSLNTALGGFTGAANITITVDPGVIVGSTTSATAGMLIEAQDPGSTVTIINNGLIVGFAGFGGSGATVYCGAAGCGTGFSAGFGGDALEVFHPVTVQNNGTIAGAGGGGSGGGGSTTGTGGTGYGLDGYAGGGGGRGAGYVSGAGGAAGIAYLCSGGAVGGSSFHGSTGGVSSTSAGGAGGNGCGGGASGGAGGTSGSPTGSNGQSAFLCGGGAGGGFLGASGGVGGLPTIVGATCKTTFVSPGGLPGKAAEANGNAITWTVVGTRYGAIA